MHRLVRVGKPELKEPRDHYFRLNPTVFPLNMDALESRLKAANMDVFPSVVSLDGSSLRYAIVRRNNSSPGL